MMSDKEAEYIALRVREEIARRRLSRQQLADKARISLSTLEKALAGKRPFTLATIIRIEEALDCALREPGDEFKGSGELAPFYLGSYSHEGIKWVEGRYLTIRPSFSDPEHIYTYIIDIRWNAAASYLEFSEQKRIDANFEQTGRVSMPNLSGHIYLVTNDNGQYRIMVLGRPTIEGTLLGILTTLQVGQGTQLVPVSCPIALARHDRLNDPAIGTLTPSHPRFAEYRALIGSATDRDYARFYR